MRLIILIGFVSINFSVLRKRLEQFRRNINWDWKSSAVLCDWGGLYVRLSKCNNFGVVSLLEVIVYNRNFMVFKRFSLCWKLGNFSGKKVLQVKVFFRLKDILKPIGISLLLDVAHLKVTYKNFALFN